MKYTPEALRASCDDGALAVEAKRRGHEDDDERREDRGRQGPGSRGLRAGGRGKMASRDIRGSGMALYEYVVRRSPSIIVFHTNNNRNS